MSIALVVTRGFGNWVFPGFIKDVVTAGYTIGDPIPGVIPPVTPPSFFAIYSNVSKIQAFSSATKLSVKSNATPIKVF